LASAGVTVVHLVGGFMEKVDVLFISDSLLKSTEREVLGCRFDSLGVEVSVLIENTGIKRSVWLKPDGTVVVTDTDCDNGSVVGKFKRRGNTIIPPRGAEVPLEGDGGEEIFFEE
jgi:hypothetical protein